MAIPGNNSPFSWTFEKIDETSVIIYASGSESLLATFDDDDWLVMDNMVQRDMDLQGDGRYAKFQLISEDLMTVCLKGTVPDSYVSVVKDKITDRGYVLKCTELTPTIDCYWFMVPVPKANSSQKGMNILNNKAISEDDIRRVLEFHEFELSDVEIAQLKNQVVGECY